MLSCALFRAAVWASYPGRPTASRCPLARTHPSPRVRSSHAVRASRGQALPGRRPGGHPLRHPPRRPPATSAAWSPPGSATSSRPRAAPAGPDRRPLTSRRMAAIHGRPRVQGQDVDSVIQLAGKGLRQRPPRRPSPTPQTAPPQALHSRRRHQAGRGGPPRPPDPASRGEPQQACGPGGSGRSTGRCCPTPRDRSAARAQRLPPGVRRASGVVLAATGFPAPATFIRSKLISRSPGEIPGLNSFRSLICQRRP